MHINDPYDDHIPWGPAFLHLIFSEFFVFPFCPLTRFKTILSSYVGKSIRAADLCISTQDRRQVFPVRESVVFMSWFRTWQDLDFLLFITLA